MTETKTEDTDVVIIGAGIIGAFCAYTLAQRGYRVVIVDDERGGATEAGMGHLVCMDTSAAEMALCQVSLEYWGALFPRMSVECAHRQCGTAWLATEDEDLEQAHQKQQRFAEWGVISHLWNAQQLYQQEPGLRSGLKGALQVPGDSIVYGPAVVRWLLRQVAERVSLYCGRVVSVEEPIVRLAEGRQLRAPHILVANGRQAKDLLPALPLFSKKGHLAITDRYVHPIRHQLVEMGYVNGTQEHDKDSVAFNVQPRPTGQLLIGSSRQLHNAERQVDWSILQQMLRRARCFLPGLGNMTVIRCWTGIRTATADGLPIIGAYPDRKGIWLAVGHEGLGVTTATGTSALLAALIDGHTPPFAAAPYSLDRFTTHSQEGERHDIS